jgi:ABC-2 type transport system ATP-binding protein
LAGITLQVPYGCVFGLIGPNGAGKSTMVKSLLGILRPTECRGTMLGEAIGKKAPLARVGYLPEHARFPEYLTGRQVVEYAAGLSNVARSSSRVRTEELLEKVGMSSRAHDRIGSYSKGMKQRIGLAQALVNDPVVVFLDEPTDGVDPEGRIDFKRMIAGMRDEGRTVFVNSHLLAEVEQVADRVAILTGGKIIRQGTVEELTRRGATYELKIQGSVPDQVKDWCVERKMQVAGDSITYTAENPLAMQPLIDRLRAAQVIIREMKEERFSLEDLFLSEVQRARQEAAPPALPAKKGGPS